MNSRCPELFKLFFTFLANIKGFQYKPSIFKKLFDGMYNSNIHEIVNQFNSFLNYLFTFTVFKRAEARRIEMSEN